jgi:hypothetical protein
LFSKYFFWVNGFTSKIFVMYVYDSPRSTSLNKLAKNGQNSSFELFKKGRKRRFTAGIAFVSACWDLPASVHINFKGKNAGECHKLNGFSGEINVAANGSSPPLFVGC